MASANTPCMPMHADAGATDAVPASVETAEFERLYVAYRRWLVEHCRRRLHGQGDAENIAQEAFARAWATADRYQGARFRAWVATIADRLCVNTFRRSAIEHQYRGLVAAPAASASADVLVDQEEDVRLAMQALAHLPRGYQRLLTLHYLDGWSYEAIARAEDVSIEAVRGRLRRARVALRQAYARLAPPGVPAVVRWCRSLRDRPTAWGVGVERLLVPWAQLGRPAELVAGVVAALVVAVTPSVVVPESSAVTAGPAALVAHDAPPGTAAAAPTPKADRPAPTAPRSPAPLAVVPAVLEPKPMEETDGTIFASFTPSPNYEADGTVFAVGVPKDLCTSVSGSYCDGVFRSTDRGRTWQRLPAVGYTRGPLLLPPNYPADPRIFASGQGMLTVSHDGGLTFVPVGNTTTSSWAAAISPDFAADGLILLGQRALEYRDRMGAVVPAPSTLSASPWYVPRFSPGYRTDRTVFELNGRLDRCVAGVCTTVATGTGSMLAVSPRHAGTGRVAVSGPYALVVSATGDGDYRPAAPLPLEGTLTNIAYDAADRLFVSTWNNSVLKWSRGGVAVSDDDGRSWRVLGKGTPLERGIAVVHPLPDGRILAAPSLYQGGGLWCSVDDGLTWHPRCAA